MKCRACGNAKNFSLITKVARWDAKEECWEYQLYFTPKTYEKTGHAICNDCGSEAMEGKKNW